VEFVVCYSELMPEGALTSCALFDGYRTHCLLYRAEIGVIN